MKKSVVIQGASIEKLKQLKKDYEDKNMRKISYDLIVSRLILKAKLSDISE